MTKAKQVASCATERAARERYVELRQQAHGAYLDWLYVNKEFHQWLHEGRPEPYWDPWSDPDDCRHRR
jgi:hypothetical protein